MNPSIPQNDLFHIWTVFNPSTTPFEVRYNDELHKVIQPGKAVRLVKMVAAINVEHLIDRMVRQQAGAAKLHEPTLRAAWREKIVLDSENSNAPVVPTQLDQAKYINESLDKTPVNVVASTGASVSQPVVNTNPAWKFDPATGEPIVNKPSGISPQDVKVENVQVQKDDASVAMPSIDAVPVPHADPETNSILNSMRSGDKEEVRVIDVKDDGDTTPYAEPEKPKIEVTREVLMAFAQNELKMAVDDATTKSKLDAMSVEELSRELNYEALA